MDFRTAEEMIGTYLKNNVRSKESDDKFFYTILEGLKSEYAPTVEMTKNDRDILLQNLRYYPFDVFSETIALSDKEKFGLPANKEFKGLSIEDLMQAWLHPETIKVISEEA